jgi:hypothetical protein
MRTLLAIAAALTGLVLSTAPAMAADAQRAIVTAEKDVPTGPRICLFSQNGKRAEPAPVDEAGKVEPPVSAAPVVAGNDTPAREAAAPPAVEVAQREPDANDKTSKLETPQTPNRVCDTDAPTTAPHG